MVTPTPLKCHRTFYRWHVEIAVDARWVADGFNLTDERLMDMLRRELPYAYEAEVGGRVLRAPDPQQIQAEQGYPVEDFEPLYTEASGRRISYDDIEEDE